MIGPLIETVEDLIQRNGNSSFDGSPKKPVQIVKSSYLKDAISNMSKVNKLNQCFIIQNKDQPDRQINDWESIVISVHQQRLKQDKSIAQDLYLPLENISINFKNMTTKDKSSGIEGKLIQLKVKERSKVTNHDRTLRCLSILNEHKHLKISDELEQ